MNYQQLNQEERCRIAALKCEKLGIREIGRRIGRSASTVSREIRRNAYPTDGSYKAAHATGWQVADENGAAGSAVSVSRIGDRWTN